MNTILFNNLTVLRVYSTVTLKIQNTQITFTLLGICDKKGRHIKLFKKAKNSGFIVTEKFLKFDNLTSLPVNYMYKEWMEEID